MSGYTSDQPAAEHDLFDEIMRIEATTISRALDNLESIRHRLLDEVAERVSAVSELGQVDERADTLDFTAEGEAFTDVARSVFEDDMSQAEKVVTMVEIFIHAAGQRATVYNLLARQDCVCQYEDEWLAEEFADFATHPDGPEATLAGFRRFYLEDLASDINNLSTCLMKDTTGPSQA